MIKYTRIILLLSLTAYVVCILPALALPDVPKKYGDGGIVTDRKIASRKPVRRVHLKDDAIVINDTKVLKKQCKKVRFIDDEFIFNGKKVSREALANQGVSIGCIGGILTINRKKIPGVRANDALVIEWDKGVLKVNGKKKGFYGLKGKGSVVLEPNSFKGYDDDEDTEMDTTALGICNDIKGFYVWLLDWILRILGKDKSSNKNKRTENNNNIIEREEVSGEIVRKEYNLNRRRRSIVDRMLSKRNVRTVNS